MHGPVHPSFARGSLRSRAGSALPFASQNPCFPAALDNGPLSLVHDQLYCRRADPVKLSDSRRHYEMLRRRCAGYGLNNEPSHRHIVTKITMRIEADMLDDKPHPDWDRDSLNIIKAHCDTVVERLRLSIGARNRH